ncbi:MAG: metallohydrolase [bacterium]
MNNATTTFFPVDNGDMTLVRLADDEQTSIMIDVNIRQAADDEKDSTRDVAKDLRERLKKDGKGRPYVDVFLLSHPDKDHCTGLEKHFYLGKLEDYPDDKKTDKEKRIVIREIWSSPIVFRRASKNHTLCDDAKAFNTEAKRRVKANKENNFSVNDGDKILIMGEDNNGKTDELGKILVKVDQRFSKIRGKESSFFEALLIGPRPVEDDEGEELLSKNHSSVILNVKLAGSSSEKDGCKFLTGGDAEVEIWERVWSKYTNNASELEYDLMQAPHHCSWHTLSHDSWSDSDDAKVSQDAKNALSQARQGASIVSSSKPIKDDKDPPCIGAKREYQGIVNDVGGKFHCTGEHPSEKAPKPLEFKVEATGGISVLNSVSGAAYITSHKAPRAG